MFLSVNSLLWDRALAYYLRMNYVQSIQKRSVNGFTLIEIIVTVAIIGIVVAFVGVNISRDTDRLARLEAKRFHIVVNEIRDEAIITGADFLLSVDDKGDTYGFESVGSQSDSFGDDGLLAHRSLEQGVELEWDIIDQVDDSDKAKVIITSLGEITPFDIAFEGDEYNYHVFVNDEYKLEQRIENNHGF